MEYLLDSTDMLKKTVFLYKNLYITRILFVYYVREFQAI